MHHAWHVPTSISLHTVNHFSTVSISAGLLCQTCQAQIRRKSGNGCWGCVLNRHLLVSTNPPPSLATLVLSARREASSATAHQRRLLQDMPSRMQSDSVWSAGTETSAVAGSGSASGNCRPPCSDTCTCDGCPYPSYPSYPLYTSYTSYPAATLRRVLHPKHRSFPPACMRPPFLSSPPTSSDTPRIAASGCTVCTVVRVLVAGVGRPWWCPVASGGLQSGRAAGHCHP